MTLSDPNRQPEQTDASWEIQTADWRDFTQIHQLERVCFRREDVWPILDLVGALTLPGLVRLKAVAEGQLIGFVGGERDIGRRLGWVTTVAVSPPYRRRGIALALLEKCEQDLGMPAIRLTVRASNDAAIRLYDSIGYQRVGYWKKYYVGGEDGIVFEKKIGAFKTG